MKTKKNRKLLMGALGLFAIGLVTAVWVLYYAPATATGLIVNSEGISFSDDFTMENVNSSSSEFVKSDEIIISNSVGVRTATASWVINNTDVTSDSCNNSGDVSVDVFYEGTPINNSGDSFGIVGGNSALVVNTTIAPFSCPQTIGTILTISE